MKKLGLAIAVATALGATSAVVNAYTVAEYDHGLLVPYASFEAAGVGTAVGLQTCAGGRVYWTWFDENSVPKADGDFKMTKNDFQAFYMWEPLFSDGPHTLRGSEGDKGYLLFTLDTSGGGDKGDQPDGQLQREWSKGEGMSPTSDIPCLAGNAFFVNTPADDVAYVPTAPVAFRDYNSGQGLTSIKGLSATTLTSLKAGAHEDEVIAMRYWIDDLPSGDDTNVVVWTVCKPPATQHLEDLYDADQVRASVNLDLPNAELNVVDVEKIDGWPSGFLEGYLLWPVSEAETDKPTPQYCAWVPEECSTVAAGPEDLVADGFEKVDGCWRQKQSALSYSIISSVGFNAVQTLYNAHSHEIPSNDYR